MNRFFRIARYSGVFVVLFVAFAVSNDCMAHAANAQTANGQSQNSRNWKHYRYDADGFTAEFPTEPQAKENDSKTGTRYFSQLENGNLAYFVEVALLPANLNKTSQQIFDDYRQGSAKAVKGQVKAVNDVSLAGNPGREFTIENDTMVLRVRLYVVQRRLYQILVVGTKDLINSAETERFQSSFQLL
ncbi:MAG TPA: hypothetical protein VN669_09405 [Candidatus Acidoferrales bacterium]|jgi:hypothetical protein|nr:hypothetical protein [Candidatus Acidoferrales bacterium]